MTVRCAKYMSALTNFESPWLCPWLYFSTQSVSKISNLCDPDPPTSQMDGRTDRRHTISILRYAL